LTLYGFRGGKTRVEQCALCKHLLLDHGELGAIIKEWREGFELSDEARAALFRHKASEQIRRWLKLDGGLGLIIVGAAGSCLLGGFRIGCYPGPSWLIDDHWEWALLSMVAVTITGAVYEGLKWKRARRKVSRRSPQAIDALSHEILDKKRVGRRRASPSAGRMGLGPDASTSDKKSQARLTQCPWCAAPLHEGATRCNSCDSDVV
jgi:hypothetical protein